MTMRIVLLVVAAATGILALSLSLLPSLVPGRQAELRPLRAVALPASDRRPLADYAATVEKPLFNPGRRKDAPVTSAAPAELPPLFFYRVVGVVIAAESRFALVERKAESEVVTLHVGDDLDGRHVDDIRRDGIVLSGPAGRELLAIPRKRR